MFIRLFTFPIKVVPNAYSVTFPLTRIHKIVNERFLRNLSVRIAVLVLPLRPFQFTTSLRTKSTWAPLTPSKHLNSMLLHDLL